MLDHPRKKYPRRESVMELRPRHLDMVERLARRRHYERDSDYDFILDRWNSIFGPLRNGKPDVPSDKLRKSIMLTRLLDTVDERRAELEADDARAACT
jgi:hypothetical protein